mmetsp:Transcript_46821/g.111392  ORF Transcript_46821/g.111392 Transcript_46821/m.111392 type:complete len:89 (+) Transcript_46821:39-305(+)
MVAATGAALETGWGAKAVLLHGLHAQSEIWPRLGCGMPWSGAGILPALSSMKYDPSLGMPPAYDGVATDIGCMDAPFHPPTPPCCMLG